MIVGNNPKDKWNHKQKKDTLPESNVPQILSNAFPRAPGGSDAVLCGDSKSDSDLSMGTAGF